MEAQAWCVSRRALAAVLSCVKPRPSPGVSPVSADVALAPGGLAPGHRLSPWSLFCPVPPGSLQEPDLHDGGDRDRPGNRRLLIGLSACQQDVLIVPPGGIASWPPVLAVLAAGGQAGRGSPRPARWKSLRSSHYDASIGVTGAGCGGGGMPPLLCHPPPEGGSWERLCALPPVAAVRERERETDTFSQKCVNRLCHAGGEWLHSRWGLTPGGQSQRRGSGPGAGHRSAACAGGRVPWLGCGVRKTGPRAANVSSLGRGLFAAVMKLHLLR